MATLTQLHGAAKSPPVKDPGGKAEVLRDPGCKARLFTDPGSNMGGPPDTGGKAGVLIDPGGEAGVPTDPGAKERVLAKGRLKGCKSPPSSCKFRGEGPSTKHGVIRTSVFGAHPICRLTRLETAMPVAT